MGYYQKQNGSAAMSQQSAMRLADGLGWFSIALGLAEVFAPRSLTSALGMQGREGLVQAYGLREIAAGIGILASKDPTPWVWSRVGGDALDLATLAGGLNDNPKRENVGIALAAVAGVTLLDVVCAQALTTANSGPQVVYDYSNRSGLPRPPAAMRGAARDAFIPPDMRTPEALRPYAI